MSDIFGALGSAIDWFLAIPLVSWVGWFIERLSAYLDARSIPFYQAYFILLAADTVQSIAEYYLLHGSWRAFGFMRKIHTPGLLRKLSHGAAPSYVELFMAALEPMAKKFGIIMLHARRNELNLFRGFVALSLGSGVRVLFYPLLGKYIFLLLIPFLVVRIWEWGSRNGAAKKQDQEQLRS